MGGFLRVQRVQERHQLPDVRFLLVTDIADHPHFGGDLAAALRAIDAEVLLLPCETDLYFRVADSAAELGHLRRGRMLPIPSVWGHRAGNPWRDPEDTAFLRRAVQDFLGA